MKKILSILTILVILIISVISCSNNKNNSVTSNLPKLEDDFYEAVNYNVIQSWNIPDNKVKYNNFVAIEENNEKIIEDIVLEIYKAEPDKTDLDKYNIYALYETANDYAKRNESGYGTVNSVISSIDSAVTINDLLKISNDFGKKYGLNLLIMINVTADLKDSTKYKYKYDAAFGLIKEYWNAADQIQVTAFKEYLEKLWVISGKSEAEAKEIVTNVTNMMKNIAELSLSIEENYNPELVYNLKTLQELTAYFNNQYTADEIMALLNITNNQETFIVSNVKSAEKMAEYLTAENLDLIKNYMKSNIFFYLGDYTSEEILNHYIEYYKKTKSINEYSIDNKTKKDVEETLSYEIGRIYAGKYFSSEVKQDIENIIEEIKGIYEKRLNNASWLSSETKQRAVLKLQMMKTVSGYDESKLWPQDIYKYTLKSKSEGGIFIDNILETEAKKYEYLFNEAGLGNPVNYNIHKTPPQTVNAYYYPSENSITILAGILQEPFYNINNSAEEKLGSIGAVIAHEITHAFDSNGSLYDENGNYFNWWQQADRDNFTALTNKVVEYYNGFKLDNNSINGTLTLSENIADLGAVSCITEYAKNNNYDLKEVYRSYGKMWAEKIRPEALVNQILTDVHSPAKIRVNAVLSATDDFYEVYNIKEGDGMFKSKDLRPAVW